MVATPYASNKTININIANLVNDANGYISQWGDFTSGLLPVVIQEAAMWWRDYTV